MINYMLGVVMPEEKKFLYADENRQIEIRQENGYNLVVIQNGKALENNF